MKLYVLLLTKNVSYVFYHHLLYVPLQDSCLRNPIDRGGCQAAVCGATKESDTTDQLSFGLPWWLRGQRICLQHSIPWRREWLPAPVVLPGESHGQRSLTGYSPWGHKEPNTTERQTLSLISTMSTTLSLLSLLTLLPVMLLLANHTLAGLAFLFLRHGKSTWKCLLLGTNSLP